MEDYAKDRRHKTGMKSLFGRKNQKKDGTDGKVSRPPRWACSSSIHMQPCSCSLDTCFWVSQCCWMPMACLLMS